MKSLKYALMFFFVVDALMFLTSQVSPDLFVKFLPQFDIESAGQTYPRLVGVLFLMLGLARLYGALFINEKGALIVSMWSWIVELIYTLSEMLRGEFLLVENVVALILAPLMLAWSLSYYMKRFRPTQPSRSTS